MDDSAAPIETVDIKNDRGETRHYETVASRLMRFRKDLPFAQIFNVPIVIDDEKVIMRSEIYVSFEHPETKVLEWRMVSCGHAEEYRCDGEVNQTSALENCETSSLGRALAFLGYGSANSIASAEEVIGARKKAANISERAPGALILLQNAAKKGMAELEACWNKELKNEDRAACKSYMPQLKRDATKVDRDRQ